MPGTTTNPFSKSLCMMNGCWSVPCSHGCSDGSTGPVAMLGDGAINEGVYFLLSSRDPWQCGLLGKTVGRLESRSKPLVALPRLSSLSYLVTASEDQCTFQRPSIPNAWQRASPSFDRRCWQLGEVHDPNEYPSLFRLHHCSMVLAIKVNSLVVI